MNFTLTVNMTMGTRLKYFEIFRLQHCLHYCLQCNLHYLERKKVIVVMELIFVLNQIVPMLQSANLVVNAVMGTTETLSMVSHN